MGEPKQVTLVLSGGRNPAGNNYSQYLQTRRVSDFLKNRKGVEASTLFGSGLNETSSPSAAPDVIKRDTFEGDPTFIPGIIRENQPATREKVEQFFGEKLASRRWQNGDRFFLFVSDHGNRNVYNPMDIQVEEKKMVPAYRDNIIALWDPEQTLYPEKGTLSVSDLKGLLKKSIPDNVPMAFVMTQCFSGGFHMLGYSLDEKGIPKKEGNICGFTAITQDTIAAGCTSFVSEHRYDGYERRIVEAITGVSVMDGRRLGSPTTDISQAHTIAMLNDNTKDVPLRTSEAYVLQYLEAERQKRKAAEKENSKTEGPALDEELEKIWDLIEGGSIDPKLVDQRGLDLIRDLAKKLEEWHPEHLYGITDASLKKISEERKAIQILQSAVEKEKNKLGKKFDKKFEPILAAYLLALKEAKNPEAKQTQDWERLINLEANRLIYSRLFQEDPTLQKYTKYLTYEENRNDIILNWAEEKKSGINEKDVETLRGLRHQIRTLKREANRLETLEGQLRRIETQMQVAAGMVWLTRENRQEALRDIASFVACENAVKIPD